jgi:histidine triad (HIT) family protein
MQSNCVFCKIIDGKIPATIIAQNEHVIAIKDINPKAPIHYLIIPKKHLSDVSAFDESDVVLAGHMILMAKHLSQELSGSQAFKLMVNNGEDAGQVVFHSHFHFLAGKKFAEF